MPSRRKKALRDSIATQDFFNQTNANTSSWCAEQNESHAYTLAHDAELDARADILRDGMSALWKERYANLTADARGRLRKTLESSPEFSDPRILVEKLQLVHKQMKDMPTTADDFPAKETFDLNDLDEVAEKYDELCQLYQQKEEGEMAHLAELISKSASIADDTTRSTEDRLTAKLDSIIFNIRSKVTVPLTSCLRQVQLFNIEKRFGLVEESYQALSIDDRKKSGEDVPTELPLSFRQMMNDPFKPTERTPKPRRKKGKKKLSGLEALAESQRNLKLVIEEIRNIDKVTDDTENFEELQSPTPTLTYADVPIPKDIPDNVQQRFLDAQFAIEQVMTLVEEGLKQQLTVRSALLAWSSASHAVWEAGKKRIHEMPCFREYEHTRTSIHAMLCLVSRQEFKIVEFYSNEGAPEFPPAMKEAFKLESLSLEEFEKDWEMRRVRMQDHFPSVDEMIAGIDDIQKSITG